MTFNSPTAWEPFGSTLLLKPSASDGVSQGGIIIPETSRRKTSSGFIIKLGPDDLQFAIGDEVFFEQHTEIPVELDDNHEKAYVIQASSVLLVRRAKPPTSNVTSHSIGSKPYMGGIPETEGSPE